jgi:hypothetical protein
MSSMVELTMTAHGYRMTGGWTQEGQDAVEVSCHLVCMASKRANGIDLTLHEADCSACRGDVEKLRATGRAVGDYLLPLLAEERRRRTAAPYAPGGGETSSP